MMQVIKINDDQMYVIKIIDNFMQMIKIIDYLMQMIKIIDYFFNAGDWYMLPHGSDAIDTLEENCQISGIPSLCIVDKNGKIFLLFPYC